MGPQGNAVRASGAGLSAGRDLGQGHANPPHSLEDKNDPGPCPRSPVLAGTSSPSVEGMLGPLCLVTCPPAPGQPSGLLDKVGPAKAHEAQDSLTSGLTL